MRKKFVLLCLLLCLAGICGCAKKEDWALPDAEQAEIMNERALKALSAGESLEMARYMCANRVYVTDEAVYTLDFDADFQPVLAAYDRAGTELSNFRILAADCAPMYLGMYEGRLYYVNAWANGYIESVDTDGLEKRTVLEKPCSYLSISEGKLWYCNEKGWFCSAEPDGGSETVILEKSCCYPWRWGEAILYQDQTDGDRLHLCWPEDGADITLSAEAAYAPQLIGDRLYFTESGRLRSMGIDAKAPRDYETRAVTGAAEFIREGESWQARCVTEDYGISQWSAALSSGSVSEAEYKGYRCCDFIDEKCRVDAVYFSDGRLRDFELLSADGKSCTYINNMSAND